MDRVEESVAQVLLAEAIGELRTCAEKIHHCVDQLNDEQIWSRSAEEFNSIGNLLLHLAGNLSERIVSVVGGTTVDRHRDREFSHREPIAKAALMATFDQAVERAAAVLAALEHKQLLDHRRYHMLAGEVESTLVKVILQTLVHLGGHTQEIVALTRFQLRDQYRFQHPAGRPKLERRT